MQILIDRAPYLSEKQQHDLRRDALQIYECYYPLQRTKDVAFEIGRLFMGLKHYKDAIAFFQDSQKFCGEHHISWYASARVLPLGSDTSRRWCKCAVG